MRCAELDGRLETLFRGDFHQLHIRLHIGFDNVASVLSVSPVLMEKYLAAAEKMTGRMDELLGRMRKREQRRESAAAESNATNSTKTTTKASAKA